MNSPTSKVQADLGFVHVYSLNMTTLWANSANNKFMIFFSENRISYFMQTVSSGVNLYEMSTPVFLKKKKQQQEMCICKTLSFQLYTCPYKKDKIGKRCQKIA